MEVTLSIARLKKSPNHLVPVVSNKLAIAAIKFRHDSIRPKRNDHLLTIRIGISQFLGHEQILCPRDLTKFASMLRVMLAQSLRVSKPNRRIDPIIALERPRTYGNRLLINRF